MKNNRKTNPSQHDTSQNPMAIIHEIDRLAHEKIKTFAPPIPRSCQMIMMHLARKDNVTQLDLVHAPAPDRFLQSVEAVDGLFIAARGPGFPKASNPLADSVYDIPWRADIFDGWHFYDSSICREYRRRGLSVVIPRQGENFWCIHCPTEKPLDPAYHKYRQRFLREYCSELKPEV